MQPSVAPSTQTSNSQSAEPSNQPSVIPSMSVSKRGLSQNLSLEVAVACVGAGERACPCQTPLSIASASCKRELFSVIDRGWFVSSDFARRDGPIVASFFLPGANISRLHQPLTASDCSHGDDAMDAAGQNHTSQHPTHQSTK